MDQFKIQENDQGSEDQEEEIRIEENLFEEQETVQETQKIDCGMQILMKFIRKEKSSDTKKGQKKIIKDWEVICIKISWKHGKNVIK